VVIWYTVMGGHDPLFIFTILWPRIRCINKESHRRRI